MHINFDVVTSEEYFSQIRIEIDWDENKSEKISIKQADEIQKILSTEVSIFLLRRATGYDDSILDSTIQIRRDLIANYEIAYAPYINL